MTLEPRDPFVVDTRPLGRQPGSMRTVDRLVAAPEAYSTAMASVPEGSEIALDLRLEAVMEGVLVTGTAGGRITAECSRCLDPLSEDFEAEFQELYRYSDENAEAAESGEDASDEDEDYYLEGDLLDLGPVVRDAVVLTLPLSPLCEPDCPGLCADCGARLADAGPEHGHGERIDPRWEALRTLAEDPGER
ncbi:YceD family protein [Nocardiopsis sp. LOL_012]|uniref:YceD family protein n=1 Tax=Nocardiopsis sp. LOL_012 TaxID=3345409 RepID=UPI003A8C27A8